MHYLLLRTCYLIHTYKQINQKYYAAKKQRVSASSSSSVVKYNDGYDDESYNLKWAGDDVIQSRYQLEGLIGKGSFGIVLKALDMKNQNKVALKIIKSKKLFYEQAEIEIEVLTRLNELDRDDKCNVVRLLDHFVHHQHQCLVFELLSFNLYDLLRDTRFTGISLNLIRKVCLPSFCFP